MKPKLKPISQQVMVITGASSGIGLVTAKTAARNGAAVVLCARNEAELQKAVGEISAAGGRAVYAVADVSSAEEVDRVADKAISEFGFIDTWVNNAAVAVYGKAIEVELADMRKQFDINYWGQVHGSRTAVRHLRDHGGALINVASAVADRAIPLQSTYCATKHALKAFTDTLRMELENDKLPISVTLIKPASIDTPFFEKAKTLLGVEPQPVPPVYAPEIVAEAIVRAAQHPLRDVVAGGSGKLLALADSVPRLADRYMERTMFRNQQTNRPVNGRRDNLHAPLEHDGGERGHNWSGKTKENCMYTKAALHPGIAAAAVVAASLLAVAPLFIAAMRRS